MSDIVNNGGLDKEVYFDQYCQSCQYEKLGEDGYPCRECLEYPSNEYSHRPVMWKEKDGAQRNVSKKTKNNDI